MKTEILELIITLCENKGIKLKASEITELNDKISAILQYDEICSNCGKYKRLQGNNILHYLCECGKKESEMHKKHSDADKQMIDGSH